MPPSDSGTADEHGSLAEDRGDPGMLERNLSALGRPGTRVAECIRAAEPSPVEFATAEDGSVVGVLGDGLRLASMHQPRGEASRFADQIDVAATAFAVILGFGLGYHVQAVVERLRGTGVVTVFEPDPGLLRTVLSRIDCTGWLDPARVRVVCDEADERQLGAAWSDLESQMVAGTRILEHPASTGRLAGRARAFSSRLADAVGRARMTISTELMRSVGTVRNELGNLARYATGSGIGELAGTARGRLGVVVSAGPSLQRNLHLLADEGVRSRCLIISAQTTLRPLLDAGVRPHFVTALDYHQISRRFYEGITASDVEGITLVALPQAHPVIADCWPGTVRWCRALVLEEVLGDDAPDRAALPAASNVAHLSYHLARHLGCDPVALVGQDLGFTDGVYYSRGTAIDDVWSTELNPFNTLAMMEWQRIVRHKGMLHRLRDVHDRPILTDDQMLSYLRQFEAFFTRDRQRGLTTLDATEGGVRKAGTESCTLKEVLEAHAGRGLGPLSQPAPVPRPGPPRSTLVRRIEAFSAQVNRLGVVSAETEQLLAQLADQLEDPVRSGETFREIEARRRAVSELPEAFSFVDRVNRIGAFKRYLADRRIAVRDSVDARAQQSEQIQRDLVNVGFFREASRESERLLAGVIEDLQSDGGSDRPDPGSSPGLPDSIGLVTGESKSPTDSVVAFIALDPFRGGAGSRRRLDHMIGEWTGLELTLQRLATSRTLQRVIILAPDDQELGPRLARLELDVPLSIEYCGTSPFGPEHEAIVAARMFADRCWRGGIAGMTAFDEVLAPQSMHAVMEREDLDGAVLVGPDWPLVEISGHGGIDPMVDRWRASGGRHELLFSQSPPGLGACLVSRRLMRTFSGRNRLATIGAMLGYRPGRAEHDPIVGEANLPLDPQVRRSLLRAVFDAPRTRYRIRCALEPLLTNQRPSRGGFSSRDIIDQLEYQRRGGLPQFTPRHVVVELCTGRLGCGTCSPHRAGTIQREAMNDQRFDRIISDLADSRDAMITFAGVGDPMQHPRCIEYIRSALDAGIRGVHVRTELQCSEERVRELAASGAQVVSVDLNADSPESYRVAMGHDGYRTAIDRIRLLIESRRCLAGEGPGALALPWVVPRIQRTPATCPDIESFYERWQEVLGTAVIDPESIALGQRGSSGPVIADASNPERTQVAETFRRMVIYSDGTVPFAEGDLEGRASAGNVDREGVLELWRRVVAGRRRALREQGARSPLVRTYQS